MSLVTKSSGASTSKKISIKPLKIKPKIPENFEQDTWEKLRAAVRAVHAKQAVGHSLEELYRAVEDMCLQNFAASVYDRLRAECEQHIESRLEMLLGQTPDVLAFLTLVQTCWADHCDQMLTLRSIFLYLDRTYAMQVSPGLLLLVCHAPPPPSARACDRQRRARRAAHSLRARSPRRPPRVARSGTWACRFSARTSPGGPRWRARRCRVSSN